jgi:nucleoside-diphosphate-sugar epimerase
MNRETIAIIGATSHIAKGLIFSFLGDDKYELSLYARRPEKVKIFLHSIGASSNIAIFDINDFGDKSFDAVINCVGYGNPGQLQNSYYDFIKVTEQFDNLIIDYITKNHDCLYINMSSGAVYGDVFSQPPEINTNASYFCNPIYKTSYYGIAKLYSEAKHRAMESYQIVDLRIFGFFSRFIDLSAPYLVNDMINCVINKIVFKTGLIDIWRDFVHYDDLKSLICLCMKKDQINLSLDVYSKEPVSKFQLLSFFTDKYNLKVEIKTDNLNIVNKATGFKQYYYSKNVQSEFEFEPMFSSFESIKNEVEKIGF